MLFQVKKQWKNKILINEDYVKGERFDLESHIKTS